MKQELTIQLIDTHAGGDVSLIMTYSVAYSGWFYALVDCDELRQILSNGSS
ncbi:MAG: hypothetical protein ACTHYN_04630 [Marinobacter sp.]|uniref:hypothetical protein n=1 Tax=Marinobacter sp. TaxID=50741 RepID=UPI003F9493FC